MMETNQQDMDNESISQPGKKKTHQYEQLTEEIKSLSHEDKNALRKQIRPMFMYLVEPKDLIPYLHGSLLTDNDEERIRAKQKSSGRSKAAEVLLEILKSRSNWISHLLDGLRNDNVRLPHLVEHIEEHIHKISQINKNKQNKKRAALNLQSSINSRHREKCAQQTKRFKPSEVSAEEISASEVHLDEDQHAVVERLEDKIVVINAGPGTGKTTTLCEMVVRIPREKRVLVLAFNKYACKEIGTRLLRKGVKLLPKSEAFGSHPPAGCLVLTFDSFGFWSTTKKTQTPHTKDKTNYRQALERAAKKLSKKKPDSPARMWDWVFIDEAQDVSDTHARIVQTLHTPHLIVAGDPRQGLYSGRNWFSKFLQENVEYKAELRYNHRSTKEIVDFINKYSRLHFPEFHYDQVATREDNGSVDQWCDEDPEAYHQKIVDCLLLSEPKGACAISPVTVRGYQMDRVTNTVLQMLHEKQKAAPTFVFGRSDKLLSKNAYSARFLFGNSYNVKALERSRVVICGIARDFGFTHSPEKLKKLYFVALSRAKDFLHILADSKLQNNNPFKMTCPGLITVEIGTITPNFFRNVRGLITVEIETITPNVFRKIELSKPYGKWVINQYSRRTDCSKEIHKDLPLVPFTNALEDYEVIQIYLKYLVAYGVLSQLQETDQQNPCYDKTVELFTSQIERPWTRSSHLKEHWNNYREIFNIYIWVIKNLLTGKEETAVEQDVQGNVTSAKIRFEEEKEMDVRLQRCERVPIGKITCCSHFASDHSVVQIKYEKTISHTDRTEAAMHAAVNKTPFAYIVNLSDGTTVRVKAIDSDELINMARAKLALDAAKTLPVPYHSPRPQELTSNCCIAVGLGTMGGYITEIAAVAFSMEGEVLGTYHQLMEGVKVQPRMDEKTSGLQVEDENKLKEIQLESKKDFYKWIRHVSGFRCFLFWGSTLGQQLNLRKYGEILDIQHSVEEILQRENIQLADEEEDSDSEESSDDNSDDEENQAEVAMSQDELTLSKCLKIMLKSSLAYVPHRAFEDAAATAAVSFHLFRFSD